MSAHTPVAMAEWMNSRIDEAIASRDWSSPYLPKDYAAARVAALFYTFAKHFAKHEIRQRIAASKATTFADLKEAING